MDDDILIMVFLYLCFYASLMLGRNSFSHNVLMETIVRLSVSCFRSFGGIVLRAYEDTSARHGW
jgi:hypothetical protein